MDSVGSVPADAVVVVDSHPPSCRACRNGVRARPLYGTPCAASAAAPPMCALPVSHVACVGYLCSRGGVLQLERQELASLPSPVFGFSGMWYKPSAWASCLFIETKNLFSNKLISKQNEIIIYPPAVALHRCAGGRARPYTHTP